LDIEDGSRGGGGIVGVLKGIIRVVVMRRRFVFLI